MKAARLVASVKLIAAQKVDFEYKVVVVDNSCNEGNAAILREHLAKYKNIELIINQKNSGYIKAHNAVSDKLQGDYVVIVNPDVLLKQADSLQKMVNYMEGSPDIGILGPKQINDSGELAMTVRAFPKFYIQVARRTFFRDFPIIRKKVAYDEMRHLDYSKIQDVDWIQSSCLIVREDLWKKIGGFNEDYFLFMSDVELCVQAWKNSYRVVYFPEVKVYADGKRVSAGGFLKFFQSWVLRQHVKDSLKYRLKYFWKANPRMAYYKQQQLTSDGG